MGWVDTHGMIGFDRVAGYSSELIIIEGIWAEVVR
jgi:hypothetical protein